MTFDISVIDLNGWLRRAVIGRSFRAVVMVPTWYTPTVDGY